MGYEEYRIKIYLLWMEPATHTHYLYPFPFTNSHFMHNFKMYFIRNNNSTWSSTTTHATCFYPSTLRYVINIPFGRTSDIQTR